MTLEQRCHWNVVYSGNTSYFGDRPSSFGTICLKHMVDHGKHRILELGPGQGRDTELFLQNGMDVTAVDYSEEACGQLCRLADVNVIRHDLSVGIPDGAEFDVCYSHMLLTMDFSKAGLGDLMDSIRRSLPEGGMMMFSVRNTSDPGFGVGINLHDNVWMNNGFAVNYFSMDMIHELSKGFRMIDIFEFNEGAKRLFGVILAKN